MTNRICKKCGVEKQLENFPKRSGKSAHLRNHTCKSCWAQNMKDWRLANPEKEKNARQKWRENNPDRLKYLSRKNGLERKYGITIDDWNVMFSSQNGKCKICNTSGIRLVVDHCHKSGNVRMLLCDQCNKGLGCFKDDPELMKRASEVIRAFMETEG